MLPGLEALACPEMAVPMEVMQHVIDVESSRNPFAIGVVGGALVRQPRRLDEALATVRMLEEKGYNFSVGLAQVNRYNLAKYGLDSYEKAFQQCPNLQAGSRILADCYKRSGGDWGKAFSCYYSGDFTTGFRHGYVQKMYDSIRRSQPLAVTGDAAPIAVADRGERRQIEVEHHPQLSPAAQARIVVQSGAPAYLPDDPARAYVVYPSTGAMVRDGLLRMGDHALSRVVSGRLERAVQPVAAPAPMYSVEQAGPGNGAALPVPGGRADDGPVMLRPWSERNTPMPTPAQSGTGTVQQVQQVQQVPAGDAAFVF
ncbi:lytic transglycosylase domain-containing protein [Stenotrophomonas sp. NLF4-10]|uniref:lytic transglycosylase domain-containing protein n=1 Tax=Stenotrophomonas sp. NLF4-10 TaxID=2918754 RepID=UPI001EFB822F|nr:lytic transglycosylase domain-containing protein [Stenotrophomonas sp. NLF4-10]MCG8277021.1 lytic transglycosylase domain-containing protein [Stenotrophomonas sp. NLF4-10]